jgi:hypothetical protein
VITLGAKGDAGDSASVESVAVQIEIFIESSTLLTFSIEDPFKQMYMSAASNSTVLVLCAITSWNVWT